MHRTSGAASVGQALSAVRPDGGADADHLGEHRRVARLGAAALLDDGDKAPLAHHEAVPGAVERPRPFGKRAVVREDAEPVVHLEVEVVDVLGAAGDQCTGLAGADEVGGQRRRREPRGLLVAHRRVRTAQLLLQRHQAGRGVADRVAEQHGRRACRSEFEETVEELAGRVHAARARPQDDADVVMALGRARQSRPTSSARRAGATERAPTSSMRRSFIGWTKAAGSKSDNSAACRARRAETSNVVMGRMPDRPSSMASRNAAVWPRLEQAATPVIAARRCTAGTLTFRFMALQRALRRVFATALALGMATAAAATGARRPRRTRRRHRPSRAVTCSTRSTGAEPPSRRR